MEGNKLILKLKKKGKTLALTQFDLPEIYFIFYNVHSARTLYTIALLYAPEIEIKP